MSLRKHFFEARTDTALAEVIRRRLLGADLGEPYGLTDGETPEAGLVQAFEALGESEEFRERWDKAISLLVREASRVFAMLETSAGYFTDFAPQNNGGSEEEVRQEMLQGLYGLYASRLCNLARSTHSPRNKKPLIFWAGQIYSHEEMRSQASVDLFGLIIECIGPALQNDDELAIRSFCAEAVTHPRAAEVIVRTFALWLPASLDNRILGPAIAHYAVMGDIVTLRRILQAFLTAPVSSAQKAANVEMMIRFVLQMPIELQEKIHADCFAAISFAGEKMAALDFDHHYWENFKNKKPSPWRKEEFVAAWGKIFQRERAVVAKTHSINLEKIRVGVPPFAEGALMLLFGRALGTILGKEVEFVPIVLGDVTQLFAEEQLDIATVNPTAWDNSLMSWAKEWAFSYHGYDLVAKRTWLVDKLERRGRAGLVSPLLTKILVEGPVTLNHADLVGDRAEELRDILQDARIIVPGETDMAVALDEMLLGMKSEVNLEKAYSDENRGMALLLEGWGNLYLGGANHANYLAQRFPEECVKMCVIGSDVLRADNRLALREALSKRETGLSPSLLSAVWKRSMEMWNRIAYPGEFPPDATIDQLPIAPLADYLLGEINDLTEGRFWNFRELVATLRQHTITDPRALQRGESAPGQLLQFEQAYVRSAKTNQKRTQ